MAREPADVAEMRQELGRELARFRAAASLTQEGFAEQARSTRSTVVNVEGGRQGTSRAAWERFDAVLKANGALVSAFDELALVKAEWDRVRPVVDLVEDTFGPGARTRTSGTVSDVRDAAVQWLVSNRPRMSAEDADQRRVGLQDVRRLQEVRGRLKALDNQCGGAAAFPLIPLCQDQVRQDQILKYCVEGE